MIQVHHVSITHNFSSAEYGIKIGIVMKAHDKLGKPGDLEHEDVLEREREKEEEKERDKGGVKGSKKERRRVERGEDVEEEKYGVGKENGGGQQVN